MDKYYNQEFWKYKNIVINEVYCWYQIEKNLILKLIKS